MLLRYRGIAESGTVLELTYGNKTQKSNKILRANYNFKFHLKFTNNLKLIFKIFKIWRAAASHRCVRSVLIARGDHKSSYRRMDWTLYIKIYNVL